MKLLICILIVVLVFGFGIFVGKHSVKTDGLFIVENSDDGNKRWIVDVHFDPETILDKREIRLKVKEFANGDV